ncbi:hypothetical protein FF011L_08270 [Roseimaritima multifibrata]|uniref:Uncharacterized protein n=1 Tax=Roseimaritima multifibrata TaxID=1930274 RepID=A0A517MB63_9BACT|nr:hypothetical protein [Roseimaritima multifibrata]QDS92091.1 hypothetical protein FF011L_08270 [Roseimaritima multifibrata]
MTHPGNPAKSGHPGFQSSNLSHDSVGSDDPPVLFRLPALNQAASAAPASPKSRLTEDTGSPANSFPPPPPVAAAGSNSFPPPPVQPAVPNQASPAPTANTAERESRNAHTPDTNQPAGRSWTENMGTRLAVIALVLAAAGVMLLISRNGEDKSLQIAEDETDQLLADLGIPANGDAGNDAAPEFSTTETPDPAIDFDFTPTKPPATAPPAERGDVDLAASPAQRAPAELPAWDIDTAATETSGPLGSGDPAARTADARADDSRADFATDSAPSAISEPATINEPSGDEGFELTAPRSPYDSQTRSSMRAPETNRFATAPEFQPSAATQPAAPSNVAPQPQDRVASLPQANVAQRVSSDTLGQPSSRSAPQPSQTETPYAVSDWSQYLPAESNPAAAANVAQQPGSPQQQPVVAQQQPGYPQQQPGFSQQQPGYPQQPGGYGQQAAGGYGEVPHVAQAPQGYGPAPAAGATQPGQYPSSPYGGAGGMIESSDVPVSPYDNR